MELISVIVPVYKVEPYLRQCVDSILNQTYTDFELILVDDGSPDNCGAICDAYAQRDTRVRVIHKPNGGLSDARNAGIDVASGDYLTFVDSDDWVADTYLEQLLKAMQETDAEVSVAYLESFDDGTEITLQDQKRYAYDCVSGREACFRYYHLDKTIPVCAQAKLYARSLFDGVHFPKGRVYEDQGTTPKVMYNAKKVTLICDGKLYAYRVRPESISHVKFSAKRFDEAWSVENCRKFFAQQGDKELETLCAHYRDVIHAKTLLQAYIYDAPDEIPSAYRMTKWRALEIMRKYATDSYYEWHLGQIYPKLVRPYEYYRKIKSLFAKRS